MAPLQQDDPNAGYLLVADRAFTHEGFKRDDLRFSRPSPPMPASPYAPAAAGELRGESGSASTRLSMTASRAAKPGAVLRTARAGPRRLGAGACRGDADGPGRLQGGQRCARPRAGDAILAESPPACKPSRMKRAGRTPRRGRVRAAEGGHRRPVGALGRAQEVMAAVRRRPTSGDVQLDVRASVGIAASPSDGADLGACSATPTWRCTPRRRRWRGAGSTSRRATIPGCGASASRPTAPGARRAGARTLVPAGG